MFQEEYDDGAIISLRHRKHYTKPNYKSEKFKVYEGDGYDSEFESHCANKLESVLENIDPSLYELNKQVKYFSNKRYTCDFVLEFDSIKYWIEVSTYNLEFNEKYAKKIEMKRKFIEERGDTFIFLNSKTDLNNFLKILK